MVPPSDVPGFATSLGLLFVLDSPFTELVVKYLGSAKSGTGKAVSGQLASLGTASDGVGCGRLGKGSL